MAPFCGDIYVDSNNWDFYLGDCIWLPLHNKVGVWRMAIARQGKVLAEKKFEVLLFAQDGLMQKYGY